ncbi:hypothetical protein M0805_003666 [Coniferiporia weirii]|nr:hypothetical protein M0805_003666 [Coniferiporia weirii]
MPGVSGTDQMLGRRGGSDLATDTNDASSYPTTPPASTYTHFQSIPEIGGSEGGFIGLVVGLGVIIIGSCIAVFFLLRNWKHGGRTVRGRSGEVGVEVVPPSPGFPRRQGTLFGFRSENPNKAGWMRAPGEDEDEWDASDNLGSGPYERVHGGTYGREDLPLERSTYGNGGVRQTYDRDMSRNVGAGDVKDVKSPSGVIFEAQGGDSHGQQTYSDPFDQSMRATSPDQQSDDANAHYTSHLSYNKGPQRQGSLDSAETAVTLPSGTKFKEDL